MQFKDVKQNYSVHILDKQNFEVVEGKITAVSFPRVEINQKTGRPETVVDVSIDAFGKNATYAIPENLSLTYAQNLVLSADKQGLMSAVEAEVAQAEQIIAAQEKAKSIIDKAPSIKALLNPIYKERQETEKRLDKIEDSVRSMKESIEKFISEFKS